MIIESIAPHPSEDDLDVVTLGPGTKCVVHKGQFKTGDIVKFVPVKTLKKGIICHGLVAHEDLDTQPHTVDLEDMNPLSIAEIFSGSEDILERVHNDPDLISSLDEVEEDDNVWTKD